MSGYDNGPWRKVKDDRDRFLICNESRVIASMLAEPLFVMNANADLIAAAPELYEMLKSLYDTNELRGLGVEEIEMVRDLLAKARGKL